MDALRSAFAQAKGDSQSRMELSGPGAFSVEIGGRTQREAQWIGSFDTLGLVVLLVFAYRSWKQPLFGVLPLASAGLAGLGVGRMVVRRRRARHHRRVRLHPDRRGPGPPDPPVLAPARRRHPVAERARDLAHARHRRGLDPHRLRHLPALRRRRPAAARGVHDRRFADRGADHAPAAAGTARSLAARSGLVAVGGNAVERDRTRAAPAPACAGGRCSRPSRWRASRCRARPFWQNDLSKLTPVPPAALARDAQLRANSARRTCATCSRSAARTRNRRSNDPKRCGPRSTRRSPAATRQLRHGRALPAEREAAARTPVAHSGCGAGKGRARRRLARPAVPRRCVRAFLADLDAARRRRRCASPIFPARRRSQRLGIAAAACAMRPRWSRCPAFATRSRWPGSRPRTARNCSTSGRVGIAGRRLSRTRAGRWPGRAAAGADGVAGAARAAPGAARAAADGADHAADPRRAARIRGRTDPVPPGRADPRRRPRPRLRVVLRPRRRRPRRPAAHPCTRWWCAA